MIAPLFAENFQAKSSSGEANSEIFVARPTLEGDRPPAMYQASDFYAHVGVGRGARVIDCIVAGSTAYRDMEASHHALNRALLFICWDLARRAIEDDGEWITVCELDRWRRRRIKPKLSDDEGGRCRFIACLIFSNQTDCGDDGASKKGRAVEYLVRKKLDEAAVIDELHRPGGIDRIYKLCVAEFPRSVPLQRKSRQSARPFQVVTVRKNSSRLSLNDLAARECRPEALSTKSSIDALGSDNPILFAPGLNERAVFLEMNKGDKIAVTIECAEKYEDRVVLTASNIQLRDDAS